MSPTLEAPIHVVNTDVDLINIFVDLVNMCVDSSQAHPEIQFVNYPASVRPVA
jgi:hypothetical protein